MSKGRHKSAACEILLTEHLFCRWNMAKPYRNLWKCSILKPSTNRFPRSLFWIDFESQFFFCRSEWRTTASARRKISKLSWKLSPQSLQWDVLGIRYVLFSSRNSKKIHLKKRASCVCGTPQQAYFTGKWCCFRGKECRFISVYAPVESSLMTWDIPLKRSQ